MANNLVIVESPAKAKTIQKYLGNGYSVIASMGHVRDLPETRLSVDIKNDFRPKYEIIKDKEKLVSELKSKAEKSDKVFLATDPDREGEAISWHLAYILGLDLNDINRVTFNEITQNGVSNGMAAPRKIDIDLVNAQQARRVLDRLVGYKLSPFLSQKIRRGLSAGRVQSVALRMIVDREKEINAFVPEEYWTVEAKLMPKGGKKAFTATLYGNANGDKMEIHNQQEADAVRAALETAEYTVQTLKKGTRRKQPAPPFITSTLQQEASRKLGFQSKRTMKVAQELYEGIDIDGMGAVGLITYMRTDSLRLSDVALNEAAAFIREQYGKRYLPESPRQYKTRKGAQDGHEAIRPTSVAFTPESVKGNLTSDQYKLYNLIWKRFVACQMANCLQATTQADIVAGDYLFKASGYSVTFDGYTVMYEESADHAEKEGNSLPNLEEGMALRCKELTGLQHFTQPPARFTEASLIKALEENGIGRPSTYAATISTLTARTYVKRAEKQLCPTELGEAMTKVLEEHFPKIVNVKFTAQMENQLDEVEAGEAEWVGTVRDFYSDFEKTLKTAKTEMEGVKIQLKEDQTDIICEKCGRQMVIKTGRFGRFIACPGYPECKNVKKLVVETGSVCPKCGGKVIEKKSKRGRLFYGCGNYPNCDFVSWDEPLNEKCPQCGKILFKKKGKTARIYCAEEGCGYSRVDKPQEEQEA